MLDQWLEQGPGPGQIADDHVEVLHVGRIQRQRIAVQDVGALGFKIGRQLAIAGVL